MMNLSEATGVFLEARRAQRYSPHTISDYQNTYNKLLAWLGDVELTEISASTVRRFLASREGISKKTLLNYHTGLSSLWTWLVENDLAELNVVRLVRPPKAEQRTIRPFTHQDVIDLLTAARNGMKPERDQAIILALLDTGLRASELCGLRYRDVCWSTGRFVTLGKGDKERQLKFSQRTLGAIRACTGNKPMGQALFGLRRDGLRQLMERLGTRAGVPRTHAHRFRHTFAIEFLRNGGNVFVLQEILGHTTLDMVRRYLRIAQMDLDREIEKASPVVRWGL
jgi:integrase/recombinase XerD